MEEEGKDEVHHLTSAVAFVEGGIQEACDDSCSICLESFCDTNPSTMTNCKHEFHLQCILEWCQRSSQCPMCWQLISLKEPCSQELLDAVEHERNVRLNPPTRNTTTTTIFRHPTLGDFELQHVPGSGTGSELEERIIQHLAAAAAMGRTRHVAARRESGQVGTDHRHPRFLVFTTHSNTDELDHPSVTSPPSSVSTVGEEEEDDDDSQQTQDSVSASASSILHHGSSSSSSTNNHQSPNQQEKAAGPSDLQSFSEAIRSRFTTLSMRYKESITKGTKGWKDRLLSRNIRGGTNEGTTSAGLEGQTDDSLREGSVDNHQCSIRTNRQFIRDDSVDNH